MGLTLLCRLAVSAPIIKGLAEFPASLPYYYAAPDPERTWEKCIEDIHHCMTSKDVHAVPSTVESGAGRLAKVQLRDWLDFGTGDMDVPLFLPLLSPRGVDEVHEGMMKIEGEQSATAGGYEEYHEGRGDLSPNIAAGPYRLSLSPGAVPMAIESMDDANAQKPRSMSLVSSSSSGSLKSLAGGSKGGRASTGGRKREAKRRKTATTADLRKTCEKQVRRLSCFDAIAGGLWILHVHAECPPRCGR